MIAKKYWTKNPYALDGKYLSGSAFTGFFLHSVATAQPDAQVFIAGRDKSNYTSSGVNGFIDDKAAWLTLPSLETPGKVKRAPHAGRPANDHYIGFEMCEPKQIRYNDNHTKIIGCTDFDAAYAYVMKVYENAVELFAELCRFHGKDPLAKGVIYSHKEGHAAGIATNHGDPDQLWSYFDKALNMDKFRVDVAAKMEELEDEDMTQEKFNEMLKAALAIDGTGDKPSAWAKDACEQAKADGTFSGNGKGDYGWQLPVTREQIAMILDRLNI